MTEPAPDLLSVELERTGERFEDITSYSLTSNYLTPADSWEFTVYNQKDPAGLRRKFAPWRRVKLYIGGRLQVIGRIDETEGASDQGALTVRGRDYLAEIVDGGADPSIRFTANQDLGDALLTLFRPYSVRTLVGNWNLTRNILTGKQPFLGEPTRSFQTAKLSDFKVQPNQGSFEVADKLVSRHGFTIQSGGQRDTLAIVEPQFGQSPTFALEKPGNIVTGRARRCYRDVPTVTIATGWATDSAPGRAVDPMRGIYPSFGELAPNELALYDEVKRIVDPEQGADELFTTRANWKKIQYEPEDFVNYRPMFYEDKAARTKEQIERGIRRELSRRLKDTLVYTCTVRGHVDPVSGAAWAVDTMATIRDEIEDVNEIMWCLERTFSNPGNGPRTQMQWIRGGSIAL